MAIKRPNCAIELQSYEEFWLLCIKLLFIWLKFRIISIMSVSVTSFNHGCEYFCSKYKQKLIEIDQTVVLLANTEYLSEKVKKIGYKLVIDKIILY